MLTLYMCFVCNVCCYAIAEWPEFINKVLFFRCCLLSLRYKPDFVAKIYDLTKNFPN